MKKTNQKKKTKGKISGKGKSKKKKETKNISFCDQLFTACDGDVLVSTELPQEVYAKLTVFTNVYLRSVPITRQGPLVSKLGLNKPENQH